MTQAVNLPDTLGGFSFKGVHSSTYGVRETPQNRVLTPPKRRHLITIPGRSSAVIQEDGGYDSRVESILCTYAAQDGVSLQRQVRLIAGWLNGVGELVFDYEPEMRYNAYLSSSPPLVKDLHHASFELEFTCNHPFAYEAAQQVVFNIDSGDTITIPVEGTVETPIRFIIENTGSTTINSLTLIKRYMINQGG